MKRKFEEVDSKSDHPRSLGLLLDDERYIQLLEKLIGETKNLQNSPPDVIPQETLAANHVVASLKPYTKEEGGPLDVKVIEYTPGRANVIIKYAAAKETDACVSFVGSHLDVVLADPAVWKRDPFKLTVEGDLLYGRGTTDCLGHVALLTELFIELGTKKPSLNLNVVAVLIADEEMPQGPDVGVEALQSHGELAMIKHGPVYWLDCADKQPNIGSGGNLVWSLRAIGKLSHSGFPDKAINALELANDALLEIQRRFYQDFKKHEREDEYGFPCSSSMKPTAMRFPPGATNQIPARCTIVGDIRFVPFFSVAEVRAAVEGYVRDINADIKSIEGKRGPNSKYVLPSQSGEVVLEWIGAGLEGVACQLDSKGYEVLADATVKYVGCCNPTADTGSLPLVGNLIKAGYDVQCIGYGVEDAYHNIDEYAKLSDLKQGFAIIQYIIARLNQEKN